MPIALAPQYTQRHSRWTTFKTMITSKILRPQYDDDGETYTIWGYDGPEVHVTEIWKGTLPDGIINSGYSQGQNDADKAEFEAGYKSTANQIVVPQTTDGCDIIAPEFVTAEGYNGCFNGFRATLTAGAQNFHDTLLTRSIKINGGWRRILCAGTIPDTDYMELSVIDKNNVTGMFDGTNPYGMNPTLINLHLTVGVDVLEIFKYVRNHYACDADKGQLFNYEFPSAKFIPAGFYLRAVYNSTGSTDLVLFGDYKWYEA